MCLELFSGMHRGYASVAEFLSFAQNARWRHELVQRIAVHQPLSILDVATGTGGVAIALARATDARITGVDISHAMLERGRQRVEKAGLGDRITLEPARAESVPFPPQSFHPASFTSPFPHPQHPPAPTA